MPPTSTRAPSRAARGSRRCSTPHSPAARSARGERGSETRRPRGGARAHRRPSVPAGAPNRSTRPAESSRRRPRCGSPARDRAAPRRPSASSRWPGARASGTRARSVGALAHADEYASLPEQASSWHRDLLRQELLARSLGGIRQRELAARPTGDDDESPQVAGPEGHRPHMRRLVDVGDLATVPDEVVVEPRPRRPRACRRVAPAAESRRRPGGRATRASSLDHVLRPSRAARAAFRRARSSPCARRSRLVAARAGARRRPSTRT